MAAASRYLPKGPTDVWSLREKLALGTSVRRSGDNNWVSVSRAIRPYGEPNRPSDWFSQRNCAIQYSELLEEVETPNRRKRGEKETAVVEAPKDVIVRKLTIERIEELKRIVQDEECRYRKLRQEIEMIMSGESDEKLDEYEKDIQNEKKAAEEKERNWAEQMAAREQAKLNARRIPHGLRVQTDFDDSQLDSPVDTMSMEDDSNMSLPSESTPLSASSNDPRVLGSQDQDNMDVPVKQEELIAARDIKMEPVETKVEISETTVKNEPSEAGDGNDVKVKVEEKADNTGKSEHETNIVTETMTKSNTNHSNISEISGQGGNEAKVILPTQPENNDKNNEQEITKISKEPEKSKLDVKKNPERQSSRRSKEPEKEVNEAKKQPETTSLSKEPVKESDSKGAIKKMSEDVSEDNSSTLDTFPHTARTKTEVDEEEKEVDVQVVDDKEDNDDDMLDSASEVASKDLYDEHVASPASSIISNDTDGGSMVARGRGRHSRGGKSRYGRRVKRNTRGRNVVEEDKCKESETSSKAESSDDEGADTTLPESDDTASNATGRHHLSFSESVPNSPASIAPGDTEDEKAFKVWKKSIMLVWRAAANHKYTNVFSHPVKEEIAPGYHSIVYRPLDLSSIKKNIESGAIRTTAEFQRDMMQMFTNAIMYNNSDHDVFHMATEMYDDVMRHIEQYVHTQIMVQGGDSKLLRPSRRSEVHSDKEDEPKRKRTISDHMDGGKTKKRK